MSVSACVSETKPIMDPIQRNNLPLFSQPQVHEKSRSQQQLLSLKGACSLFSWLYFIETLVSSLSINMHQACLPSLQQMGKLRSNIKSDLLGCLEKLVLSQGNPPAVVKVI